LDEKTGKTVKSFDIGSVKDYKYRRMIGYKGKLYVTTVWRDEREWKNEKLYVNLWAYDLKLGKVVWQFETGPIVEYGLDGENIGAWLSAADGKVFLTVMEVHDHDKLYCFDAVTGKKLWSTNRPERAAVKNTYPAIGGGKVFLGTEPGFKTPGGKIVALDENTGAVAWEKAFREDNRLLQVTDQTSMIFRDGKLFVPFGYGQNKGLFKILDASSGEELGRFLDKDAKGSFFNYSPLVDDKSIYESEFEHYLCKLNRDNGSLVWRYAFRGGESHPLQFQTPTHIAYTDWEEPTTFLVFVEKATGKESARYDLPSRTNTVGARQVTGVAADGNFVVVTTEGGRMYGLSGASQN